MKKKATTRILIAIICLSISASMLTKLGGGEGSFSFQALLQGIDNAQVIDWDIGHEIGKYQEWISSWTKDNGFLEVIAGILNVIVIPIYIIIGIGAGIIQLVIIIVNLIIPQVVSEQSTTAHLCVKSYFISATTA